MMSNDISKLITKYLALSEELYDIASNINTEPKVLEELATLSDSYILTAIAVNPNTPVKILKNIYQHYTGVGGTDEEMRVHIVNNVAMTAKSLKKYADVDESEVVREAAKRALKHKTSQ